MASRLLVLGLAALGLCLDSARATAAPVAGEERALVEKVNKAISDGVQYIKQKQQQGKHWEGLWLNALADMDGGVTALATLAMLNCGEKPDDRSVKAAMDYLRDRCKADEAGLKRTYVVGLMSMVFAEGRQKQDLPRIQLCVNWLVKNATRRNGKIIGWSYPFGPNQPPDGSNTQYALLGLYAGKTAGAKIDDATWREIRDLYIKSQGKQGADNGYWTYTQDQFSGASFTMTVAGVSGLLIAGMGLNESEQQLDPATGKAAKCGKYDANEPITRGMNYIGKNFSFDRAEQSKSTFYNIYGIERVGRLSGQRFLGNKDWYREGCVYLTGPETKGGQQRDGSWVRSAGVEQIDGSNVISTSFALLFLSKGRTPVLISKLAHGDAVMPDNGVLVERGDDEGVIGWNRKHNDARHLTEFASRELFNGLPLGWQVYDPRRKEYTTPQDILDEVGVLVQTPILYFNGHHKPKLRGQHKEILKKYIEEGGFVVAEACCGSPEFTAGFRELVAELFQDSKLDKMPAEHAIWKSFFPVPPTEFPKLECLDRGCRTVLVFSPEPLAGYWEESKYMPPKEKKDAARGELAFRLSANIIAYATGMEPPKQRLTTTKIANPTKQDLSPPKGFIKPAQLKLGEAPPAPNAMRNLMSHLKTAARIDTVLDKESMPPGDEELFKYKFVYAHGRKRFELKDDEIENLKANLQAGGVLFADSCCGKPEFDASFRAMIEKLFPGKKLQPIPVTDDLFSAKLNGAAIMTVKRREKADGAGPDGGFKDMPPLLEGIQIDGRWAVIYSKYDIGCALENHKSTDCLGHDRESALRLATAAVLYALKK